MASHPDGKDDGVRYQVGSDDPSSLFVGGGKIAGYVRDGDVDDRGVENFHEGRQHHGAGDDPGVYRGLRGGIQAFRSKRKTGGTLDTKAYENNCAVTGVTGIERRVFQRLCLERNKKLYR